MTKFKAQNKFKIKITKFKTEVLVLDICALDLF